MTDLPLGWTLAELRDLVIDGPTNGYSPKSGADATGSLSLKLSATTQGRFILNEKTTKRLYEAVPSDSKYWLQPGDLLVQRSNSPQYLGRSAVFQGEPSTVIYPDLMMRLRITDPAIRGYLWRYLNSRGGNSYFRSRATGTAGNMPKINGKTLRQMPIPCPPLNEQRRIVAKIEALTERSRRAREALDAIPPLLERFRQSVLAAAFRGDLTRKWREKNPDVEPASTVARRVPTPAQPKRRKSSKPAFRQGDYGLCVGNPNTSTPDGWAWVPLVKIARLETGHTPSRRRPDWWGGSVPWIGVRDASTHHGRTIFETRQCTNEEGLANSAARLLPKETVCLSRTATIGWVVVMGREMATSQDFVNWVCTEAIEPQWLKYLFMAEKRALLSFSMQTTNVATIYFPQAIAFHVCLPPPEEQKEIVRLIEERLGYADRVEAVIRSSMEQLPKLNQSILAKAFRGELVPQDPNDEPASVLVERIRKEREAAAAKKPKKARRKRKKATKKAKAPDK